MPFRVITPRDPLAQRTAASLVSRPRIEWRRIVAGPREAVRRACDVVTGPRRRARERKLAAQERRWLRLSAMTDAEVVGLDRSVDP